VGRLVEIARITGIAKTAKTAKIAKIENPILPPTLPKIAADSDVSAIVVLERSWSVCDDVAETSR
jgi:hypothetical protein